jgi:hypothetical protein
MRLSAYDWKSVAMDRSLMSLTVSQLFDSEMRSAVIEAETREEVMREIGERMISEMEKRFARRLLVINEVCLSG